MLLAACLLGTLASCGPSSTEVSDSVASPSVEPTAVESAAPEATPETTAKPTPGGSTPAQEAATPAKPEAAASPTARPALTPGQYCYRLDNDTLTENIRLTVNAAGRVTGDVQATIHNEAAGYYSSYVRKLTGALSGNQANLQLTTWIEYDVQKSSATWTVRADSLKTDRETLSAADCTEVSRAFQGPDGLEAEDLLAAATAVNTERVKFKPGSSSTAISQSVVRGERDVYLLGAEGGQRMNLTITSLEGNAVFDLVDPSGLVLARESTQEELILPHTGDYQVIVGGTRGNASYELSVGIE